MWGSNTCAAAGRLADRTVRPGRGRRGRRSSAPPRRAGRHGASSRGRRSGSGCPQITYRSRSGPPVATDDGPAGPGSSSITATSGAAWRQPSCSPRRRLPAVNAMATLLPGSAALARHPDPPQPVEFGRGRGTPGSASRRSTGCTDRGHRAWASSCTCGPCRSRSGLDADLPGPAHLPAAHQASPPLAWLPGSDQPSKQAGTTKPEPHGARPPYSSAVGPPDRGDLCWIVSVGGCGSQAGRSALASRCARGEAQPLDILNWQLSF
jgi:hypothetical protein